MASLKSIKAGWVNPNSDAYGSKKQKRKNSNISLKDIDISTYDFSVDKDYIDAFNRNYEQYFKNVQSDYEGLTYSNANDMFNKYSSLGSDLRDRARTIKAYYNSQKKNIDSKQYDSFMAVADIVEKAYENNTPLFWEKKDFYSNFETEDDYKAYEKDKKRREQMAVVDLKVVQSEIDDLEGILKKAEDINSNIHYGATTRANAQEVTNKNKQYEKKLQDYLFSNGYKNIGELRNAVSDKKFYKDEAQKVQDEIALDNKHSEMAKSEEGKLGWEKWLEYDDQRKSEAGKTSALEEGIIRGFTTSSDSPFGTVINNVIYDKRKDTSYQEPQDDWTKEEKNIWGAYFYEGGYESAANYAAKLNNEKAIANKNKTKADIEDSATSGFWSGAGHTAGAIITSPFGLADYLDDLTDAAAGRNTIAEEDVVTPFEYSGAVKGAITENWNEWSGTLPEFIPIVGGKGVGDIYGTVVSAAESYVSTHTLGSVGTAISYLGQGAASVIDDAVSRGATMDEAIVYGTIVGAAEAASEYIGAEKLLNLGSAKTLKGFFNKALKNAGAEGLEGGFSSVVDKIADAWVLGDKSVYNTKIRQYRLDGMSESEAVTRTFLDTVEEVAYDSLNEAVAGLLQSAPKIARANAQEKKIGRTIKENNYTGDMLNTVSLSPQESDVYQIYTELANSGVTAETITDAQLGGLFSEAYTMAQETLKSPDSTAEQKADAKNMLNDLNVYSQNKSIGRLGKRNIKKVYGSDAADTIAEGLESDANTESHKLAEEYKKKNDSGKNLTAYEITKLVDANQVAYKSEVKADVEAMLAELGATSEDNKLTDIIVKKSVGEKLTTAENELLQNSEIGNRVYNEINNEELVGYTENMEESDKGLFLSLYDGKADVEAYAKSYDLVSQYAKGKFTDEYIFEHKGVLSATQASAIIGHKIYNKIDTQKNAIASLKEKHKESPRIYGKFDDSVIDYDNANTEGKVNWSSITKDQRNAITVIGSFVIDKGMDVELITDGKERGINGAFAIKGSKILIDIYAGMDKNDLLKNLKNLIFPTFSHELTHWMKEKSPELYRKYSTYVIESLKTSTGLSEIQLLERRRRKMEAAHPGETYSDEDVRDEVIARASEDMLGMSETMREFVDTLTDTEKRTFVDKVKEILQKLKEWFENYISKNLSVAQEAQDIRAIPERIEGQIKLWDSMLVDSIEANQALKKEGITGEELAREVGNKTTENSVLEMSRENTNIANYTETQYNNFGWVTVNNVLTGKELKKLYSQFANIKLSKNTNYKNKLGEYLIPVGAKYGSIDSIVYIKGTNKHPIIRQIVKITALYKEQAENIITEVIKYESTKLYFDAFEIIGAYAKTEFFSVHKAVDYPSYIEARKRARRQNGRGPYVNDSKRSKGKENPSDSRREVQGENAGIKMSDRDSSDVALSSHFNNSNNSSTANKNIIYSDRHFYAPTFYSYMGKTINEIKQDKLGADSVIPYLKGKGVKNEEIKWSGIEEFLEGKKSVSKSELKEFVAGSMLQIEENLYEGVAIEVVSENGHTFTVRNKETRETLDEWVYSENVENGKKGYINKHGKTALSVDEIEHNAKEDFNSTRWSNYKISGGTNYRELIFKLPNIDYSNEAMREHWGENANGILAHTRIQDFDINGKKMLFIEEIQSDLHNEGREIGYVNKLSREESKKVAELNEMQETLIKIAREKYRAGDIDGFMKLMEIEHRLSLQIREIEENEDAVPEIPFKDSYHEYILKRLIRMAAEQDYDSIGWTTANIQSQRWSDEYSEGYRIEYDQDIPKFLKKYGKKWDAKVGTTTLNNGEEVWSMDITNSMKTSVLYQGQVMYLDRENTNIDKYGYNADNISRANKEGDFINEFHSALGKAEWSMFYKEIKRKGYLAITKISTIAPIVVKNKLVIAELKYTSQDKHDYIVIDAFKLENYENTTNYLLRELEEIIAEGTIEYDSRTIYQKFIKFIASYGGTEILSRFNRNDLRYDVTHTTREKADDTQRIHGYSQEGIDRAGLPLRDKPSVQKDDELLKHSDRVNQDNDKYGYNADNISRANKQGELVNEYYNALNKKEWKIFYDKIADEYYLATAIVGTFAPIVVNDKLVVAERLYNGKNAHDYVVIDAFELQETYDGDLLDSIKESFDEGVLIYDRQTVYQNLSRILKRNQSTGILTRYDANSKQYVLGDTQGINGKGNEGIHGDSQDGIDRAGLPLRDKSSVQKDDELLKYSDRVNQDNDKYGYNADNISRANKQGDFINEFYNALSNSEWHVFYSELVKQGYIADTKIGTIAPIVVKNKLVIAERKYTAKDKHDYVVIDAYKLVSQDGDNYTLSLLQDALNKGDIDYDTQRIFSFIDRLNRSYGTNELLTAYNRGNSRYDITLNNIKQGKSGSEIHADSQEEITRDRLSLGDKPSVQKDDELLKHSDRVNQDNDKYWESYELSTEFINNVPYSERHDFLRSLANKTSGMKHGERRNIGIITDKHIYFYEATGYMNGSIAKRSRLTKKANAEIKVWSDYYGSVDASTATFDSWLKDYGSQARRNDRNNVFDENGKTTRQVNNVDAATSRGNIVGDTWESTGDFGEDEELIIGSIVYNDNGEAFKVTEDGSIKSIKYADRETVSIYDLMGERDRLLKENEKFKVDVEWLKERLKLERQVTNGNFFNKNQLSAVAGHLRNLANSDFSKTELIKMLDEVYSYIAHSENLNWEDLYAKCYDIAKELQREARPIVEKNYYAKGILADIRSKRISLSDIQKGEIKYATDKSFQKAFWGKIKISNDGIPLDTQWQEWAYTYPDYFDKNTTEGDQVVKLYEIYEDLRDAQETIAEYDEEDETRWLAQEVYNQYWNVSPIRTTADKYDKQIKRLNYEHRKIMKELRDAYNERLQQQHKSNREKTKALVKGIRERKDKEIAEVRKLGKERMDAYKENAARKTKIQAITTNALTLNRWLAKNSKDEHIHQAMKGPVVTLLNAIDFSSKQLLGMKGSSNKGTPTQKDISLQKALSKVKDMMKDASAAKEGLIELYGHDMDEEILELAETVDDITRSVGDNEFVLNKMTLGELETLDKLVKTIKHAVTKINTFHTVQHKQGIANLSENGIEYLEKLGKATMHSGVRGNLDYMLKWNNTIPYYAFKRLGEAGEKVFEALQDGWDKLAYNAKQITDFTNKVYTSKEVVEWGKKTKSFTINQPDGSKRTFDMTIAQIMALHCVAKQKDAQRHLLSSGMTIAEFDNKGKVKSEEDNILLSITDIETVTGTLDKRQLEVANKLQEFMNTVCADWGNEVSMQRFATEMFTTKDYFPIKVSPATITKEEPKDVNDVSMFRLLNMSFTNSRNEFAKQSIEIGNIFDIFAQHTSDMAKYNALALPILDAYRWYSYKGQTGIGKEYSTYASLQKALGKDSVRYFNTFMKDLNGASNVARDNFGTNFFRNAKIASVAANLRVVLLQPTAYLKASAVIDNRYLTQAFLHIPKVVKAEKYCGMALWKSMGYYDVNITKGLTEKIKHDDSWRDKAIEFSMKGAEVADKITFGYLWNACELETRKTRKDLKVGSVEFYTTIGKRLREVIYATQVVDSTMTRSQIMRSTDGRDKMLTAFMSEPTLAYNMLMDCVITTSLDKRKNGKGALKRNFKRNSRVFMAYIITNMVAALIESCFDAFRNEDEEEDDLVEFTKHYLTNFASDMSIIGKIPYLKEIPSLLQGYSPSRTDTQWMESFVYAGEAWAKIFTGEGEGKGVKVVEHSLRAFSNVSGLAFFNAYRDLMAALNKLDVLTAEELEELFDELFGY